MTNYKFLISNKISNSKQIEALARLLF